MRQGCHGYVLLAVLAMAGTSRGVELPEMAPAAPKPGTLMIVGGGPRIEPLQQLFVELAAGKSGRIVYIPTATQYFEEDHERDPAYQYWRNLESQSFEFLHTRDPKEASHPAFTKPLTAATGVWMGGGAQENLLRIYGGSDVPKRLREVLARGGVVAGTSAGASIMSETMIADQTPTDLIISPGFSLCPRTVVDCHFSQRKRATRMLTMLERYPTHHGVGIDDDTALLIQGETMTVVGQGSVSFFARDVQTDAIQRVTLSASEKLETSFLLPWKQDNGEPATMVSME